MLNRKEKTDIAKDRRPVQIIAQEHGISKSYVYLLRGGKSPDFRKLRKLSDEDKIAIMSDLRSTLEIAQSYGISRGYVCRLRPGHVGESKWKHPSNSPEYRCWKNMLNRCRDENHPKFKYYGGRGVSVCARWESFDAFVEDMGLRPPGRSIERKNNDGNYEPDNCKWASKSEQERNKRKLLKQKSIKS